MGIDRLHAVFSYEGAARGIVTGLKYANNRALLPGLVRAMADLIPIDARHTFDAVTWVPTTSRRRRQRGFDQSALLAHGLGEELVVPSLSLIRRLGGPAQTGRGLSARQIGPAMAPRRRSPGRVLLVDDVITTGSTASAAGLALREGGAQYVAIVALARTPRR